MMAQTEGGWSRPLRGGVDRNNSEKLSREIAREVAPFAGAWIETPLIGRAGDPA